MNNNEVASHLKNRELTNLEQTRVTKHEKCCADKNMYLSEMCALETIRGEVRKLSHLPNNISDCMVSEWVVGACSATCGKGTRSLSRDVVQSRTDLGTECLPLHMYQQCSDELCPIDCELDTWSGWSACSAECGSGVKERTRDVLRRAEFGGIPCEATTETVSCNVQACDKDCELADWTEWSLCTKACDGGKRWKRRDVAHAAVGQGACPEVHAHERVKSKLCNLQTCKSLLPPDRQDGMLHCNSKVDFEMVLDESGSVGYHGWKSITKGAARIIRAMRADDRVAVIRYSGPWASNSYFGHCVLNSGVETEANMEKYCHVSFVQHFVGHNTPTTAEREELKVPGPETIDALANTVEGLANQWNPGSTLTSAAVGMATREVRLARQDAARVVMIITDGRPLSHMLTEQASHALNEKVDKTFWVALATAASDEVVHMLHSYASWPSTDNTMTFNSLYALDWNETLNEIIADVCSQVE